MPESNTERFLRRGVLLLGLVVSGWRADTVLAGVTDIPIVEETRIDSLYTTDNYFSQNIKIIKNAVSHDAGSEVRGMIALPQLPDLSSADLYSAKIWMCETYYYGPPDENAYTRGVTLYPLTQGYNLTTVTWQSCNGGQCDASNPVAWSPAPGMASGLDGYWWCSWNITPLWSNSDLRNNGALLTIDPETPPSTSWITKYFASNTYSLTQYQPFVEVVQMDRWNDISGNWSTTTNWNTGTPPNVTDAVAGFLGNATQDRTVTVDSPVTVGGIIFDNAAHRYTLVGSGDNSITMSALSGEAAISVNNGSQEISAPIVLACNMTVTVANATDTLTLGGDISGDGTGLTLAGSGTLFLNGENSFDGGTTVNSGTLCLTNPDSLPDGTSLTVGAGAAAIFGSLMAGAVADSERLAAPMTLTVPEPAALTLLAAAIGGAVVCQCTGSRRK
jgi:autotransporter-associated beta strand protein